MSLQLYLAYVAACVVFTIVPGPMVSLVIANGLTHGTRAALLNVAGSQLGLGVMMAVLAVGLATVVEAMGWWFDWLRLAGAVYLMWLGWKLLRNAGGFQAAGQAPRPRGGFLLQGFLVMASNPKALLFFGAFIPQFIDPTGNHVVQIVLLGATAMAVAAVTDGTYAVLTGRAGRWLTARRVRLAARLSGLCLIGGGAWMALARDR